MSELDEVRKQSRELQEKLHGLHEYWLKFRQIRQGITGLTYKASYCELTPDEVTEKSRLEKELKGTRRQIRKEYGFGESKVDGMLKEWDFDLSFLSRKIDYLEYKEEISSNRNSQDAGEQVKVKSFEDFYKKPSHMVAEEHCRKQEPER